MLLKTLETWRAMEVTYRVLIHVFFSLSFLLILGQYNIMAATPPTPDSVTPNTGSGTSQSFTFKYSSVNGYNYLNTVNALINGSLNVSGGCFAYYVAAGNALYLLNDAGSAATGPLTPGAAVSLSNSQCTLNGVGSSAVGTGNTLALTLAVVFSASFKGPQTLYGWASDNGSLNSAWQTVGMWTSVDPSASAQTVPSPNPVLPGLPESSGVYQLRYFVNLNKGDSYVNLTNAGTLSGLDPAGRTCINVYTFDPFEEMISCCACPVTPNGLRSLSVRNDLISNTLTPGVPTSIIVKLLSSLPLPGNTCDASSPTAATLVRGMRAWATTLHLNTSALPTPGVYQHTETEFSKVELSEAERSKLSGYCSFIQALGSGYGICKSCRTGALGAQPK
jgi:hypothetical protein